MLKLSTSEKKLLSVLLIVSIAAQVFFTIFFISHNSDKINMQYQGTDFDAIAQNIVSIGKFSRDGIHDSFYRPPLYPYVLAFTKIISQENSELVRIIFQAVFSVLCSLLVALTTLRLSKNKTLAISSFVLYLLHSKLQVEHLAERETVLFEFCLLIFILLFISNRLQTKEVIFLSALSGIMHLARPNGFTLLLVLIAGILVSKYMYSNQLSFKHIGLAVGVFCLVNLPWQLYNYTTFGKVTLSSSNTNGLNLYKGNDPVIQEIYPQVDVDLSREYLTEKVLPGLDMENYTYQDDSTLRAKAIENMLANPVETVQYMAGKFVALYSPLYVPFGKGDVEMTSEGLKVNNFRMRLEIDVLVNFLLMLLIIPIGILGLVKIDFQKSPKTRFQLLAIFLLVLNTSIFILTFAETRFRLPFDNLLIISFCLVVSDYFRQLKIVPRQLKLKHD